jgi:hypothetical protein
MTTVTEYQSFMTPLDFAYYDKVAPTLVHLGISTQGLEVFTTRRTDGWVDVSVSWLQGDQRHYHIFGLTPADQADPFALRRELAFAIGLAERDDRNLIWEAIEVYRDAQLRDDPSPDLVRYLLYRRACQEGFGIALHGGGLGVAELEDRLAAVLPLHEIALEAAEMVRQELAP